MSITVTDAPDTNVCARNPVIVELQTNNYISTAAVLAFTELHFTDFQQDGDSFVATFMGVAVTFTFSDMPDASGTQIKTNDGYFDFIDDYVVTYVIPALLSNYEVSSNYDVFLQEGGAASSKVRIRAKKNGSAYSWPVSDIVATGLSVSAYQANVDPVYRPNFRILCDLVAERSPGGDQEDIIFRADGVPDAANKCRFNFSQALRDLLGFAVPDFTGSLFTVFSNPVRRFRFRFAESYGDTIVTYLAALHPASGWLMALNGAESFLKYPARTFHDQYCTGVVKFLTAMPRKVVLHRQQHQYLHLFVPGVYGSNITLYINVKLYYTDHTAEAWTNAASSTGAYKGKVVSLRVGYDDLDIDSLRDPDKDVLAWELRITTTGPTVISETMRFNLHQEFCRYPRYMLFINSFGFPETIFFSGQQKKSIDFENDTARRIEPENNPATGVYYGEFDEINSQLRESFELNTGNRDKSYIAYFADFLLSPLRFQQLSDRYVQLALDKQSVKMPEESDTLFSLKFNYKNAWLEAGTAS